MRWTLLGLACATIASVACSSSDFDVASSGDSGTAGEGATDSLVDDGDTATVPDSIGAPDSAVDATPADATCALVAATTEPDLYVNAAATGPSNGTAACPFHHVLEATSIDWVGSGLRTIHVAAGDYVESGAVVVGAQVVLEGSGATATTIEGAGSACSIGSCVVQLSPGSNLHGFAVKASGTNGIVLAGGATAPRLYDFTVSGATGGTNAGVVTTNDADIGPGFAITNNQRGIDVTGAGKVSVRAPTATAPNVIESSVQSGIFIEAAAQLVFAGGEIRHNGTNGIYANGGIDASPHQITNASIHGNTASGLLVSDNASAVVRSSAFLGNAVGVRFAKGPTNSLDLGKDGGDAGDNSFGTTGTATKPANKYTAVCVDGATAGGGFDVPAHGDTWPGCPPTTSSVGSCDPAFMTGLIATITYANVSASPVSYDPCTVTPP